MHTFITRFAQVSICIFYDLLRVVDSGLSSHWSVVQVYAVSASFFLVQKNNEMRIMWSSYPALAILNSLGLNKWYILILQKMEMSTLLGSMTSDSWEYQILRTIQLYAILKLSQFWVLFDWIISFYFMFSCDALKGFHKQILDYSFLFLMQKFAGKCIM